MVNERFNFGVFLLGLVVGLTILLIGVTQNAGQALNQLMVVGGVVVVAAFGIYTRWVFSLDEGRSTRV